MRAPEKTEKSAVRPARTGEATRAYKNRARFCYERDFSGYALSEGFPDGINECLRGRACVSG